MALSAKRRKFVTEYLRCFNSSEAARRAGYSPRCASVTGARLLGNASIWEKIQAALNESDMLAAEVIMRLSDQARGGGQYIDKDGQVDIERIIADNKGHIIKSIKETSYGMRVEFADSLRALTILAKYHGLLDRPKTLNVTVTDLEKLTDDQLREIARKGTLAAQVLSNLG